jgi:glucose/arabinose dehydrogenase
MKSYSPIAIVALAAALSLAACGSGQAARSSATGSLPGTAGATTTTATTAGTLPAGEARKRGVRLVRVGSFEQPIGVTGAPGDRSRVFVVQRAGQIVLLRNGHTQAPPFLDVSKSVYTQGGDEEGLLGLALPTDYARSGLFYVDYTVQGGDIEIVQYRRSAGNANVADAASARLVLRISHHEFSNHNGGQMAFGPEGDLFIGVGDGGSEGDPHNNGQSTDTLLGKILRIAPSAGGGYTIPSGNPFAGQSGKRPEIWAYGLRNPWRFSFDRATGDMIVGDVGQDQQEEVDFIPAHSGAGANYGWSIWEGTRRNKRGRAPGAVAPTLTVSHSSGYCAIIGGYVVRDRTLGSLYGRYLFGDFCRPQIESVELRRGHASGLHATGLQVSALSSMGQDASGHIYLTSLNGPVYRIAATG